MDREELLRRLKALVDAGGQLSYIDVALELDVSASYAIVLCKILAARYPDHYVYSDGVIFKVVRLSGEEVESSGLML